MNMQPQPLRHKRARHRLHRRRNLSRRLPSQIRHRLLSQKHLPKSRLPLRTLSPKKRLSLPNLLRPQPPRLCSLHAQLRLHLRLLKLRFVRQKRFVPHQRRNVFLRQHPARQNPNRKYLFRLHPLHNLPLCGRCMLHKHHLHQFSPILSQRQPRSQGHPFHRSLQSNRYNKKLLHRRANIMNHCARPLPQFPLQNRV